MPDKVFGFNKSDTEKISRGIRQIDRQGPPSMGGGDNYGWQFPKPVWIKITGNTAISGQQYRWKYSWVEEQFNNQSTGSAKDVSGGMSSSGTGWYAYNSCEANNSSSFAAPYGALSSLPSGSVPVVIATGTIVVAWITSDCATPPTTLLWFSLPNDFSPCT
jgi:hypothetical protein